MRILNIICSTDASQGGVIEWVRQFAPVAQSLGHMVEVASMDPPGAACVSDFPVKVHAFGQRLHNFRSPAMLEWLTEHANDYDLIIGHGLWRYPSYVTRKTAIIADKPYFIYTHGMLDPWFKRYYPLKHILKSFYWWWREYKVLRDAERVIFTCEQEKLKAAQSFTPYTVIPEVCTIGIKAPVGDEKSQREGFLGEFPETRDKSIILFLGRIHLKKGCDTLIEAFAGVSERYPDMHLVFAGPGDPALIRSLQSHADDLGIAERITWTGMISGDIKWGAFLAADAFILPSHQENFGISVVEALACGCPVLISDKVDIYAEIDSDGAGLVGTEDLQSTVGLLDRWMELDEARRQDMRDRARECYQQRFDVTSATRILLRTLETASAP